MRARASELENDVYKCEKVCLRLVYSKNITGNARVSRSCLLARKTGMVRRKGEGGGKITIYYERASLTQTFM
jgi:hypothetical protein